MANALAIEETMLMSRGELIEALHLTETIAAMAAAEASDLELARYAATYAAAWRSGNPEPLLAVSTIAPPTTENRVGYSKQMIAEARRRGLLRTYGGAKPDELTARSTILLRQGKTKTARR